MLLHSLLVIITVRLKHSVHYVVKLSFNINDDIWQTVTIIYSQKQPTIKKGREYTPIRIIRCKINKARLKCAVIFFQNFTLFLINLQ